MKQKKFTLSSEERENLQAVLRQRKIDGLVLRRANVLLLLDEGWHISKIAAAFYLNIETIRDWRRQFDISGLDFLPMSDYSQREGHLSFEQEQELKQGSICKLYAWSCHCLSEASSASWFWVQYDHMEPP